MPPRWGGVAEPMTVITNVVLAGVAFVLGVRLAYPAAAEGVASASFLALGFFATAMSAAFGAAAHGLDPRTDAAQRERCWRAALFAMGVIGAACIASVAFFTTRGPIRSAILVIAGLKLVAYFVSVSRRPQFRVAVADHGGALAVLLAGSVYAYVRWRAPAAPWLIAGVFVSVVAGVVQARRVVAHRHFNHNDLYHVAEMVALYLCYRGGALLVDR